VIVDDKKGRPPILPPEARTKGIRIGPADLERLDAFSRRRRISESEVLRDCIRVGLTARRPLARAARILRQAAVEFAAVGQAEQAARLVDISDALESLFTVLWKGRPSEAPAPTGEFEHGLLARIHKAQTSPAAIAEQRAALEAALLEAAEEPGE
jgi:hypothetical protein